MKKVFIGFLFFLILVSTILIYVQWNEYKEEKVITKVVDGITSNAKINSTQNKLDINQKISIKNGSTIELKLPSSAKNIKCNYDEKTKCKSYMNANTLIVDITKNKELNLNYIININPTSKEIMLVSPFFAPTKSSNTSFNIDLIENSRLDGEWISGANNVASSKKQTLNYFRFKSSSMTVPLFYTSVQLKKKHNLNNGIVYLTEENGIVPEVITELHQTLPTKTKINFIISSKISRNYYSKNLVVLTNKSNNNQVLTNYISSYLLDKWTFNNNYSIRLLSALILNNSTDPKIKQIIIDWNNNFDEKTQKKIIKELFKYNQKIYYSKLIDTSIRKTTGEDTNFFELNETSKDFVPYFSKFNQHIYINNSVIKQSAIKYDKKVNVPISILENFGFMLKASDNNNKLIITKTNNKWEFINKRKVFNFNNEYYEAADVPLTKINGQYYISDIWSYKLFKIEILHKKDMILITEY